MDAVAFAKAAKQEQRIKKVIAEPDSVAGLVTVPKLVPTGETVSIPAGRTLVHPNLQVDGTLDIQGTLFIPSGGSASTTLVDATIVKQNGSVVANDSTVVHKTGDETIAGVKTFSNTIIGFSSLRTNGFASFGYGTTDGIYLANYGSSITGIQLGSDSVGFGAGTIQYRRSNGTLNFMNGDASAQIDRLTIDAVGNVLVTGSGGLGYGTGSGGTVTQLTSKSTAVTLNKPCGQITMNSSSLAAGSSASFILYNSLVSSTDNCIVTIAGGPSGYSNYRVQSTAISGGYVITITNTTGVALLEVVVLSFAVIKGATA